MGIKARNPYDRIKDVREENKDNPNYPKIKKINNNLLEIIIGKDKYELSPKEALSKFKNIPFFTEEYEALSYEANDLVSINLKILEEQLKSKFD